MTIKLIFFLKISAFSNFLMANLDLGRPQKPLLRLEIGRKFSLC